MRYFPFVCAEAACRNIKKFISAADFFSLCSFGKSREAAEQCVLKKIQKKKGKNRENRFDTLDRICYCKKCTIMATSASVPLCADFPARTGTIRHPVSIYQF